MALSCSRFRRLADSWTLWIADDTCAAVVSSDRRLLSNVVLKQSAIHESFGGIHPMHAQEAHQANMPVAIQRALADARVSLGDLDGIAATRGPGMYGCLSVCLGAAKALAAATGKPLIGVHHMVRTILRSLPRAPLPSAADHAPRLSLPFSPSPTSPSPLDRRTRHAPTLLQQAHALTPFLTASPMTPSPAPEFPFLTLLLSGGHTLLLLARSPSSFRILASTADESIGASLDKASRDLGVPWALGAGSPGAALERFAFPRGAHTPAPPLAEWHGPAAPTFAMPFARELAFSYAGQRSALTRLLRVEPAEGMRAERKEQVARAFMEAAFEQVAAKVELGMRTLRDEGEVEVKGLVVGGGVASNLVLRERCVSSLTPRL